VYAVAYMHAFLSIFKNPIPMWCISQPLFFCPQQQRSTLIYGFV